MLFLSVPLFAKVVSVFRVVWNANWQQKFPGRLYVRAKEKYVYRLDLILITRVSSRSIEPGRDCDSLNRTFETIKTFLEPL